MAADLYLSISDGPGTNTALRAWAGSIDDLTELVGKASVGPKAGSYFVRGPFTRPIRNDDNIVRADVVVIDGDKRIDPDTGEVSEGAPAPHLAHEALRELGIQHLLFTTWSHDPDRQHNRWRAVIPAPIRNQVELLAVVDHLAEQMNQAGIMVANSRENGNWSQAWYLPRVRDERSPFAFFDGSDGEPIDRVTVELITAAWETARAATRPNTRPCEGRSSSEDADSPIGRFNADYGNPDGIINLLEAHGYRFYGHDRLNDQTSYRLIRAGSASGIPGVHLYPGSRDGRWLVYCHHAGDALDQRDENGRQLALDAFEVFATLEHGGDKKKAATAAAEHFRQQDQQTTQDAADDPGDFLVALRRIAEMDPIPGELQKKVVADAFNVPGYTVERALGHLTRSLRPSYPKPPDPTRLAISREERLQARMHPRCIVHDYLFADVALLSAPGGTGKTTLVLFELIHIVLGRPLHGLRVQTPGPVLLVTAEDPREILLGRLNRIMADLGLSESEQEVVDDNILIWDCSGEMTRLVEIDQQGNLTLTGLADEIVERMQTVSPVLIVLDPIVSFGPGENRINDAEQMLILAARRMVRGLNCCVRYVTHVSQNAARAGTLDQYASRGGTALADGARMVAVLQAWDEKKSGDTPPMTLDRGPTDKVLILARPKLSYAPPQPLIWLARQEHTFTHALPIHIPEEAERAARADQLENFLVSEYKEGRKYSKNEIEEGKFIDMPRAEFRAALAELEVSGRVAKIALSKAEVMGARKFYLHPIKRLPIAPNDDGGIAPQDSHWEAA